MNYLHLMVIAFLLSLPSAYSQCTGIDKVVNLKKQRTTFYSPHYDSPLAAPIRFVRFDTQDNHARIQLAITVLGDSARFDPADVDSMILQIHSTFLRLAQRDSLQRALPQKSLPTPATHTDSLATRMDSVLTIVMRPSFRDSLLQAALTHKNEPVPMVYKGSWLTFSDGTRLAWPTQSVYFELVEGRGTWTNSVYLSETQLEQLSRGLVSEVSVYKYQLSLTKEQAEQARQILNCMKTAK